MCVFKIREYTPPTHVLLHELLNRYQTYQYINFINNHSFQDGNLFALCSIKDDIISNIFLIRKENKTMKVLNPFYLKVDPNELKSLVNFLFDNPIIEKIMFNSLLDKLPLDSFSYPIITDCKIEDNIVTLPSTYVDYLNTLGKQTKKHAKYYVGRMNRDFPTVEYIYKTGNELTDKEFDTICHFSSARMQYKSLRYVGDDEILKRNITNEFGFGFLVKIEGEIKAGCIGYILGEHLYLSKIAHDVAYNNYNLGNVVLLKLIEYSIEHNIKYFHFLWGKHIDYKKRFGGKTYPLSDFLIFKSKGSIYYKTFLAINYIKNKKRIHDYLHKKESLWKILRRIKFIVTK